MSALLDVVLTTHNDAQFLREAIASIIYGAKKSSLVGRIVVVDDASRVDEAQLAAQVVAEMAADHADILLIRNNANCGLSHSRNRGLRFCASEYVTFLDADDMKPAGWGAMVRHLLETHAPDYLFTASALIDDRYEFGPFYDAESFSRLFKSNLVQEFRDQTRFLPLILEPQIGNKYFRLTTINQYLFPIGRKFEDLYLVARMTLDLDRVVGANVVTHLYNITERMGRVTMLPKLKTDIIGNLAGLIAIYTHHFDLAADALQQQQGKAGTRADKEIDRQLRVLQMSREFAFAALKFAFARMIDWSINTIGIGDVETFADRAARVVRTIPTNPSVAQKLAEFADPATLAWYDNLTDMLITGDRSYFGQVYA